MMKLIFLGSGSAFTVGADNFQSNMLFVGEQNNKLLIDCGSDIRFSLHAAGFSYLDITDIYISHLHSDHVGGLEYIAFSTLFDPRCKRPNLYLSKDIAIDLWDRTLSGVLSSLDGDIADLGTFFKGYKVKKNGYFTWEEIKFNLVKVIHVNNGYYIIPSYGLFFEVEGVKVFLSTDTQFCPDENWELYERAELIFHDCETSHYREHPVSANRLPQQKRFLLTQALADNLPIQNPKSKIQNGMLPHYQTFVHLLITFYLLLKVRLFVAFFFLFDITSGLSRFN